MPVEAVTWTVVTASWKITSKDMQDVEFTIEHRKLWMLQTRNGKRTARAAIKMAVDMVTNEGLIGKPDAVHARDAGTARPAAAPAPSPPRRRKSPRTRAAT
jgi:pyruvate,orthophosphate dikinase